MRWQWNVPNVTANSYFANAEAHGRDYAVRYLRSVTFESISHGFPRERKRRGARNTGGEIKRNSTGSDTDTRSDICHEVRHVASDAFRDVARCFCRRSRLSGTIKLRPSVKTPLHCAVCHDKIPFHRAYLSSPAKDNRGLRLALCDARLKGPGSSEISRTWSRLTVTRVQRSIHVSRFQKYLSQHYEVRKYMQRFQKYSCHVFICN